MTHILPVYGRSDYMFERGDGVYLYDHAGREYLDFASGIGVNSLGHGHPAIVEALKTQGEKLWHVSNMYQIDGLEKLATRICDHSFADYVFFCNSGAEAVETGIKMVRKYHDHVGNPDKYRIITFEGCFHGRTLTTISAAKKPKVMAGFEPAVDGFDQVPFADLDALKAAITPETGGILLEVVQGEGGIREFPAAFLKELRHICDEKDLLLFFDGVQCGAGRTGKFYSHEWAGVNPDICSSAKGIGGGFPLGATLCTKRVGDAMTPGSHGSTYGNNPLGIAVGNAVMDVMLEDGFFEHVQEIGEYLQQGLQDIAKTHHNLITDVRGRGLMIGIEVNADSRDAVNALRKIGLLTIPTGTNVIRMLPPLVLTKNEAHKGLALFKQFCEEFNPND